MAGGKRIKRKSGKTKAKKASAVVVPGGKRNMNAAGGDASRVATSTSMTATAAPQADMVCEDPFGDEIDSDQDAIVEDDDAAMRHVGAESVGNRVSAEAIAKAEQASHEAADAELDADSKKLADSIVAWHPYRDAKDGEDNIQEEEVEPSSLVVDNSGYHMLHRMNVTWPCLSLDILRDNLGEERSTYPQTMYMVTGTQAADNSANSVMVMKLSNLRCTTNDDVENEESDDEDEEEKSNAIVEFRAINHSSAINRIRSMPQAPHVVSTWGADGVVRVLDIQDAWESLDGAAGSAGMGSYRNKKPIFSYAGHADEGFAMAWSPNTAGRLATGDMSKFIQVWEPKEGAGWSIDHQPFVGHTGSVEDICWSPAEATVFASVSCDQTLAIWDTRMRSKPALRKRVANCDVNVVDWNSAEQYLMATGADDGSFSVWDLRTFGAVETGATVGSDGVYSASNPVAHFDWHNGPISSIAWMPGDDSVLSVVGADHQTTVWDLAVEGDDGVVDEDTDGIPPQLLFIHMGQNDPKELRWHPQCPGAMATTAADGFNVFRPINL